jgi:hypothetical protein
MDFTGKIIEVLPIKEGKSQATGNPWKVQSYVIEDHGDFPRKMCFDVFGEDKIKQFNIQPNERDDGLFRYRRTQVARSLVQLYQSLEGGSFCPRTIDAACSSLRGRTCSRTSFGSCTC